MFKKKLISTEDEDDDYEYIGNENDVNLNESNTSSTSNKNDIPSSGLPTKDKEVIYLIVILINYSNLLIIDSV